MTSTTTRGSEVVLLGGDDEAVLSQVEPLLKKEKIKIKLSPLGEMKNFLQKNEADLVIFGLLEKNIPSHLQAIFELKQEFDTIPFFALSKNTHWEPAVQLIKAGINEYFQVPVNKTELVKALSHHLKLYKLTRRIYASDTSLGNQSSFEGIIGQSEPMRDNFRMIAAVAKSNATVLITGESGTGKELVARAIHNRSNRAAFRMVDLNCGAIPRDLLENELFGHERGAFTGAHRRYNGSFEVAHKGTLFLDEISEMNPLLQVKLLRVLQERSFMRIGGTDKIDVDVRIVAATNRNIPRAIEEGLFREDLYYRLNVVNINIPALRERRMDIPLLAQHFLEIYSAKNNRIFVDFSNDSLEALINYDWPGNVRELENTIERIVVLHNDSQVKIKFFPKHLQKVNREISYADISQGIKEEPGIIPLDDLERRAIEMALMRFQGNIAIAAKKLNLGQATLYRKVKKYGLKT